MTDTQKFTHNPVIFTGSQVDLVDHIGDDVRACMAARVSLLNDDMLTDTDMSISAKDLKLIHFLMREKHTRRIRLSAQTRYYCLTIRIR